MVLLNPQLGDYEVVRTFPKGVSPKRYESDVNLIA